MDRYIGFDIDSKKTVACVIQKGQKDIYASFGSDTNSMRAFLCTQRVPGIKLHLTFEISGQAELIYDNLVDCVDSITVSNPSKMTWIYRTSKKNDRIDARKQAVLLSIGEIPAVHIPGKEIRQWRRLILHRRNIVKKATQIKNRIRAVLKSQGTVEMHSGRKWWSKTNRNWMGTLCNNFSEAWHITLKDMLDELALLENQLNSISIHLDAYLQKQPGGILLMSIPGIGPRTAEAILAYTDNIERFTKYKHYCSYFGLTPKLDESGSMRHLGHITKQGPSLVRWLLCESAWRIIRKSSTMRSYYNRVMADQADRRKIALVAVARKTLCIIRAMLMTGELFNEELVGQHCTNSMRRSA